MLEELRNLRTLEGAWTATLWQSAGEQEVTCCVYIDWLSLPVYADKLIPRGLIGCDFPKFWGVELWCSCTMSRGILAEPRRIEETST